MIELISIHIPKTAGRSFLAILNSQYDSNTFAPFYRKNFPDPTVSPLKQFIIQLNKNIKVIHGHFHYNEIADLQNIANARVITWFREPVERVISNYWFFKKRITLELDNAAIQQRKNESLLEYCSHEDARNRMNKFIAGLELSDFFFIGITEYFNSDINVLAKLLNWNTIEIPRINDNFEFKSLFPPVTNEEKKVIANMNKIDIELYNNALEMRAKRLN